MSNTRIGVRPSLEQRIAGIGRDLRDSIESVLDSIPGAPHGPQSLAQTLSIDKVLASRVLKATHAHDPMAVIHHVPGPEPLRRLLRSAAKAGVAKAAVREANRAVDDFESLIRREIGDRSSMDAIISAWLPEARRDFEMRRKQSAYRAMSQLKGAMAETSLATVILNASEDGDHIDVVWVMGLLGLQRLRPGVMVKLATRRMGDLNGDRAPINLNGDPIRTFTDARLDEFCSAEPAKIDAKQMGDILHYTLGGDRFGPNSAADFVMAEANLEELPRYLPREIRRKGNVFAEIATPAKSLLFDVLIHQDVYPGSEPQLLIYDTALDGVADVNDPARDVDRMDMLETIQILGQGTAKWRNTKAARYVELLREVFSRLGWDDRLFRGYRCEIDYPVYGWQVAMAFDLPSR